MIKSGRDAVSASAIALVHADDVHPLSHAFGGDADHVTRIARTFESVDEDDGQRTLAIGLPVTVTEDFGAVADVYQTPFRRRYRDAA